MEAIWQAFPVFLLVMIRILAFLYFIPIFSYRNFPSVFRTGLSAYLAAIVTFTLGKQPIDLDGLFILLALKEVLVGASLGIIGYIMMTAMQVAGGFIDFQMGFAIANVIDPFTGAQSPVMGQYLYLFAILFLLATDGHHLLIDGIVHSFQFIPPSGRIAAFGEEKTMLIVSRVFATMFLSGVQIAIPIVGSLFLVDVALAIVSRTVPQMNIFVVGIPAKILISFLLFLIILGPMVAAVGNLFEILLYALRDWMALLGQG